MYQKFANAMPLYRQEQDWKQLGVGFKRAALANWIIYCAQNYFRPMYDYFHRTLLARKYLMADETRIQVLKEPGRNPETESFMWLFRSGKMGLRRSFFSITQRLAQSTTQPHSWMASKADTWKQMDTKDTMICPV